MTVRKSVSSISIRLVWPFIEIAREHDCDVLLERYLAPLGLSRSQLEHPDARLPLRVVSALISALVEEVGLGGIGLEAAQKIRSEHIGLPEYIARSKDTLGAALISSVQYARLLCDGVQPSIEIQDNLAFVRFWLDTTAALHDTAYEFVLATQLNSIRRIAQTAELAPLEVHFMHPKPADVTLHERLFQCRLRFNMPFTQLVFPASAMALPLPGSEAALSRLLELQANLSLEDLPNAKRFETRVRSLLASELGSGDTTARRVAQRLGISPRTLARRLKNENTNYQVVFDQTRRDLALRDLTDTPRSIRDIAKRLGFASSQSFHRAFRRWTGSSVMSYRRSSRQQARA